jgi:UDPglucose--hexose-1-phosphate uridylyltransferase
MPELRQEPITKKWVIIATERSKRPSDFAAKQQERRGGGFCPFCGGNEGKTPPEVMAYREKGTKPNTPGWWVRVVPNLYPALTKTEAQNSEENNFYQTKPGLGAHEVLIESPEHNSTLENHSPEHVNEIFFAWRDRYKALSKAPGIRYVQIFKNEGSIAGASLEHPHSQLIATPLIPPVIDEELKGARDYYQQHGKCIYCEIIERELKAGARLVASNYDFLAFCPFASRFPFETWIIPREHQAGFDLVNDDQLQSMSGLVQEVAQKVSGLLNYPPYNMILHSAPAGHSDSAYYHWHLEILPRLTIVAGFELGAGIMINPTPPESAAKYLREENAKSASENEPEKERLAWRQIH